MNKSSIKKKVNFQEEDHIENSKSSRISMVILKFIVKYFR